MVHGLEAVVLVVVGVLAPGTADSDNFLGGAEAQLRLKSLAAVFAFSLQKISISLEFFVNGEKSKTFRFLRWTQ